MTSTLAAQLQKLRDRPDHDHKLAESFLFSKADARSYSREQIQQLAMEGIRSLARVDNRIEKFVPLLFDITEARKERSMLSKTEAQDLEQTIDHFMTLLAPHFLSTSAHQVFEYLVRVHEVHTYSVRTVLRALLPYHDHGLFARVVMLLDLRNTGFDFMKTNQDKGAPLPRGTLVIAAAENPKVLSLIVECAQNTIKYGVVNNGAIGLWVGVSAALATTPEGEAVFRVLLPCLIDWIPCRDAKKANRGIDDLPPAAIGSIASGALIVLCAWSGEVALGVKTLSAVIDAVLQAMQVTSTGLLSQGNLISVLAHLVSTQKAIVSQAPFTPTLTTMLEEVPWGSLSAEVEAARGTALVTALVNCASGQIRQHEASRRFLAVAAETLPLRPSNVQDILTGAVRYQYHVASAQKEVAVDEHIRRAVQSLQRRYPVAFDQTLGSLVSNPEVASSKAVDSFLVQILTGTRYQLVETGDGKLPLSACLLSHIPEVRQRGIESLKSIRKVEELGEPVLELLTHTLEQENSVHVILAILNLVARFLPDISAKYASSYSASLIDAIVLAGIKAFEADSADSGADILKAIDNVVLAPSLKLSSSTLTPLAAQLATAALRLGLTLQRKSTLALIVPGHVEMKSTGETVRALILQWPDLQKYFNENSSKMLNQALNECLNVTGPNEGLATSGIVRVDVELGLQLASATSVATAVQTIHAKLQDAETVKRGTAQRQEGAPIRSPWIKVFAESITERITSGVSPGALVEEIQPLLAALSSINAHFPSLLHCNPHLVQPLLSSFWNLLLVDADPESGLPKNASVFTLVAQAVSETTGKKINAENKKNLLEDPMIFLLPLMCPAESNAGSAQTAVNLLRHLQSIVLGAAGPMMTKRNALVEAVSCLLDERAGVEIAKGKKADLSSDTQAFFLAALSESLSAGANSPAAFNKAGLSLRLLFIPKRLGGSVIKHLEPTINTLLEEYQQASSPSTTKKKVIPVKLNDAKIFFLHGATQCVSFPTTPVKKHLASTTVLENIKRMDEMATRILQTPGLPIGVLKPVLSELATRTSSVSAELLIAVAEIWRQGGGSEVVTALAGQHRGFCALPRGSRMNHTSMVVDLFRWVLSLFQVEVDQPKKKKQRRDETDDGDKKLGSSHYENHWSSSDFFVFARRFKLLELLDEVLAEALKQDSPLVGLGVFIVEALKFVSNDTTLSKEAPSTGSQIVSGALGWSFLGTLLQTSLSVQRGSKEHDLDDDEESDNVDPLAAVAAVNFGALVPAIQSNERAVVHPAIRAVDGAIVIIKELHHRAQSPDAKARVFAAKTHVVKTVLKVLASVIAETVIPNSAEEAGEEEGDAVPGNKASNIQHLTTEGNAAALTASASIKQLLHTVVPMITFNSQGKRANRKKHGDAETSDAVTPPSLFHVPILSMLLKLSPFLSDSTGSTASANQIVLDLLLSFEPGQQAECLTECLNAVRRPETIGEGLEDEEMTSLAQRILKPELVAANRLTILTFVADVLGSTKFLQPFVHVQELKYANHGLGMNLVIACVEVFSAVHDQEFGEANNISVTNDESHVSNGTEALKFVVSNILGCILRSVTNFTFAHSFTKLMAMVDKPGGRVGAYSPSIWKVSMEAAIDRLIAQNAKAVEVHQYSTRTAHLHSLMQILKAVNSGVFWMEVKKINSNPDSLERVQLAIVLFAEIVRSATRSDLIVKTQLLEQMDELGVAFDTCHTVTMQLIARPKGQAAATLLFDEYVAGGSQVRVSTLKDNQAALMGTAVTSMAVAAQCLGLTWMTARAGDALTSFAFALKCGIRAPQLGSLRFAGLLAINTALPATWIMLEPYLPTLLASISSKLCAEDPATAVLSQDVLQSMGSLLEARVLLPQITAAVNRAAKEHSFAVLFRFVEQQLAALDKADLKQFDEIMQVTLFTRAFEALCVSAADGESFQQPDPEDLKAIFSAFKTFFIKFKENDGVHFFSKIVEWAFKISPKSETVDAITHLDMLRWQITFSMLEHYLSSMGTLLEFIFPVLLGPMVEVLEAYGPGQISQTLNISPQIKSTIRSVISVIFVSITKMSNAACDDLDEAIAGGTTSEAYLAGEGTFEKIMPPLIQQAGNIVLFGVGSSVKANTNNKENKEAFSAAMDEVISPSVRSFMKSLNSPKLWSKVQYQLLKLLRDRSPIVRAQTAILFESLYSDGGDQMAATIMAEGLSTFTELTEDGDDDVAEAARKLCIALSTITGQDVLHAMA